MDRASTLRRLVRGGRGDVVIAVLAGLVQVGGTALAARHQPDARTLDVFGYLLLAAGPAALVARRRWPAISAVPNATISATQIGPPG